MKKSVFGRHFKRDTNERKAMFKNLLTALVVNEQLKTTEAKAKAIRAAADKLITKAKKGGRDAYRGLEAEVHHDAVVKLIDDLAGRFTSRNGGYTRTVKLGNRVADNAPMAMMEWVEKSTKVIVPAVKEKKAAAPKKVEKKTEKKSSAIKTSEDKAAKTEKKAVKKAK